jgi:hypothetical protein
VPDHKADHSPRTGIDLTSGYNIASSSTARLHTVMLTHGDTHILLLLLLFLWLYGPFSVNLASLRITTHSLLCRAFILSLFICRVSVSASTLRNDSISGLPAPRPLHGETIEVVF